MFLYYLSSLLIIHEHMNIFVTEILHQLAIMAFFKTVSRYNTKSETAKNNVLSYRLVCLKHGKLGHSDPTLKSFNNYFGAPRS